MPGDIEKQINPKPDLQTANYQGPYADALVSIKAAEKLLENRILSLAPAVLRILLHQESWYGVNGA